MICLRTTVSDPLSPMLKILVSRLGANGKAALHEAAAHDVHLLVRSHILDAAKTRHLTADTIRNGHATRTGHLTEAAKSVAYTFDQTEGLITVSSPGFRRALGPLTILPREKEWLTIPVDALAYGRTVLALKSSGYKIFRPGRREAKKNVLAITEKKTIRVLFALSKSARLKHDPGLLPTENKFKDVARKGVEDKLRQVIQEAGL